MLQPKGTMMVSMPVQLYIEKPAVAIGQAVLASFRALANTANRSAF